MSSEMMDLEQVAHYLRRDKREVSKMVDRGHLPGKKVSGEWRFARAEINHWIETNLSDFTDQQLTAIETHSGEEERDLAISSLLTVQCMAVPLPASTRTSVLKELVNLAEQSWQVYDPDAVFKAICQREEMACTGLDSGVAIPHPRRPMPLALAESVLAYGRTSTGIPFGADRGGLTDIFFMVCCVNEKSHLSVLARLSRLLLRPGFVDGLRAAESAEETWNHIHAAETDLMSV